MTTTLRRQRWWLWAPVCSALALAACTEEADDKAAPAVSSSTDESFESKTEALSTDQPGICSNNKAKSCAASSDCGGATCYLPTAGGATQHNQVCMADSAGMTLNCNAKDIGVTGTSDIRIVKPCAYPGDTAIVSFVAEYTLTAQDRYDLGVWIAEDGGDSKTGMCSVSSLPTGPTPPWSNSAKGATIPDTCGDVTSSLSPMYSSIQNIDIKCIDTNGDGFADPSVCLSWNQPGANIACNQPIDSHPGAPSKCRCQPIPDLVIPIPGVIRVDKVTDPVGDTTSFVFDLKTKAGDPVASFSLSDGAPVHENTGLSAGTYVLTETLSGDWKTDSATCTSDQGNTPDPANLVLHNGETVTCTFVNSHKLPSLQVIKTNNADHIDVSYTHDETVPAAAEYPYTVPYRLEIKNLGSGGVTLSDIVDDKTATLTAPVTLNSPDCASLKGTVLAGGATAICYYDVVFASADVSVVINTATVMATNSAASLPFSDSSTVRLTQAPAITLTKTPDISVYKQVGDIVHYTLVALNSGNTTLHDAIISDPKLGPLTCAPAQPTTLGLRETLVCKGDRVMTLADIDAGQFDNTATVNATSPQGSISANASASVKSDVYLELGLTKKVTPSSFDTLGQVLTFTVEATNRGAGSLFNVVVLDPQLADFNCSPALPVTLPPGATITCTGTHVVDQADLDARLYTNVANAQGKSPAGNPVDAPPASVTVPGSPPVSLALTKVASPKEFTDVGQVISYTLVATNTGHATLHDVSISDPKLGTLTCSPAQPAVLAPAAQLTCTGTHTITQADMDAEHFENTALASGKTPWEENVPAPPATENVIGKVALGLTLQKTPSPVTYGAVGQIITYTFVATNSGKGTLTAPFLIDDDRMGLFQCSEVASLAPGATLTCTHEYAIQAADIKPDFTGQVINTASVSGKFGPKTVTSPTVQALVKQSKPTAQITPTDTSCSMFAAGTAATLMSASYMVKGGLVLNGAPGVFFYYSAVVAPGASFTIKVPQVIDGGFSFMPVLDDKQVVLYNDACGKSALVGAVSIDKLDGSVSIPVSGATKGQLLYVGIKYAPSRLKGQTVPTPWPTVKYTFGTLLDAVPILTSWVSINLVPKKM